MTDQKKITRPHISERERLALWAAAAGRCTFCNRYVVESEDLGLAVPIGEMAHIVGWGKESPRGESNLTAEQRQTASNLILACRNCHKPIDDNGVIGLYTVDELLKRKREHEGRIHTLTEIGTDRSAYIVRMVGMVRGVPPELSRQTVLVAATAAGLYPRRLPGSYWDDVDLDLRSTGDPDSEQAFEACLPPIHRLTSRVHDGVRGNEIDQIAVFGFARIPLLIALGVKLDDKLRINIFQRQRREDDNAWKWPDDPGESPTFSITPIHSNRTSTEVSLIINLSGSIPRSHLPDQLQDVGTLYALNPVPPASLGPNLINSPKALANFESTMRDFMAQLEVEHTGVDHVNLFAAAPVSAAVVIGIILMPDVSPAWRIYDRSRQGTFFEALEVRS